MAKSRSTSAHSNAAIAFIIAGVLFLLDLLLTHVGAGGSFDKWLVFIAYLALAVGFVILFLVRSFDLLLRVAFIVGAVGWALLALGFVANTGNGLDVIAEILALAGTLVAGVIVFVRHIFTRRASLAFLVLAIIAAIYLFFGILGSGINATLDLILAILFGAMLVVAGYFLRRR